MTGNPMAALQAASAATGAPPSGAGNTTQGGTSANTDSAAAAPPAPQAGNATQAGVASVPTNQADVINQMRAAATGPSPSSTGAPAGALAALNGAAGNPGASATPTPTDPIGGANSGLLASAMAAPKMIKVARIDGQDWYQPQQMAPQQASARQALITASLQSGLQGQSQQAAAKLEQGRETFEGGQQKALFQQQTALEQQRADLETQLNKATTAVQYANIAAQITPIRRSPLWGSSRAIWSGSDGDARVPAGRPGTGKVVTDLKPIEDQLNAIGKFQAITPEHGQDQSGGRAAGVARDAAVRAGRQDSSSPGSPRWRRPHRARVPVKSWTGSYSA